MGRAGIPNWVKKSLAAPNKDRRQTQSVGVQKRGRGRPVKTPYWKKKSPTVQNSVDVQRLRLYLLGKFAAARFSSVEVCEICSLVKACGIDGLDDLSWDTYDHPSLLHNASRAVIKATGLDVLEKNLYSISIPWCNEAGHRRHIDTAINLLQDLLVEEVKPQIHDVIKHARLLTTPNWMNNSVRRHAEENNCIAIPYGVFVDGAPWKGKGAGTRDAVPQQIVMFIIFVFK